MGGGGSRHHYVQYTPVYVHHGPTDAQIKEQIRRQNQQNARIAQQARQAQLQAKRLAAEYQRQRLQQQRIQRENFAQAERQRFKEYLYSLNILTLQSYIPKIGKGQRHYCVVGPISSGKTTLLNSMFNTNQDVGLGQTTGKAKVVYRNSDKKLAVWDAPGINQDFSIYDPHTLGFFMSCDKIFILYKDSPKRCQHIIKTLSKVKPSSLYFVRTQCDSWDPTSSKTLDQQRQEDINIIKSYGAAARAFYQHSSYKYGYDNQILKHQISY